MSNVTNYQFLRDPVVLSRVLWPRVRYYNKQQEVLYSVWHNKETVVPAGNMMGKDFIAGRIALMFFLTRTPCRVVTTSVDHTQLEGVLWGEIRNAIQECVVPIEKKDGGPLVYNHLKIRKVWTYGPKKGEYEPLSYLLGRQAKEEQGMAGHHVAETGDGIPRTLFIGDEASGLDDELMNRAETWADRILLIGNPYPCANRFYRAVEGDGRKDKGGDILSGRMVRSWEGVTLYDDRKEEKPAHHDPEETEEEREDRMADKRVAKKQPPPKMVPQFLRKIIHISCKDSPNVRLAEAELEKGMTPSDTILVPGVMSYWKFKERERMWDDVKRCIQLYGRFYKGKHKLLFPPQNLNKSEALIDRLRYKRRVPRAIGCDPGEGEAETVWYVVDDWGILDEIAMQTPDTSEIFDTTLHLIKKWDIDPIDVMFDSGGQGHAHADYLARAGYPVQTVSFGESLKPKPQVHKRSIQQQYDDRKEKGAYRNRRAMMYGYLADLLEPTLDYAIGVVEDYPSPAAMRSTETGDPIVHPDSRDPQPRFCIPGHYQELRRQLSLIPKLLDGEGKLWLPSKSKKDEASNVSSTSSTKQHKTLTELIGCSPDRADALVVAVYCRDFGRERIRAGAV